MATDRFAIGSVTIIADARALQPGPNSVGKLKRIF